MNRSALPLCLMACWEPDISPVEAQELGPPEVALMGVLEEAAARPGTPRVPSPGEQAGMISIPGGWVSLGPSTEIGGPKREGLQGPPGPPPSPLAPLAPKCSQLVQIDTVKSMATQSHQWLHNQVNGYTDIGAPPPTG